MFCRLLNINNKVAYMRCPCCQGDDLKDLGKIPASLWFSGRLLDSPMPGGSLYKCKTCSLQFRYPQPDKKILDSLYLSGAKDNWQTPPSERIDWQIAKKWLFQNLNSTDSILDLGCYDGSFLRFLSKFKSFFGIEIQESAARCAEGCGIKILGSDFEGLAKYGLEFDAVTAFDVIEHVSNPLDLLKNMVSVTKESGVVIISTGNTEALSWRLLKSEYWYCGIGEHISFICPEWCNWAADELNLNIIKVIKFTRGNNSILHSARDILVNLLYRFFPKGFVFLRKIGFGGDEFRKSKEMLKHPPSWLSANDHFICIYSIN